MHADIRTQRPSPSPPPLPPAQRLVHVCIVQLACRVGHPAVQVLQQPVGNGVALPRRLIQPAGHQAAQHLECRAAHCVEAAAALRLCAHGGVRCELRVSGVGKSRTTCRPLGRAAAPRQRRALRMWPPHARTASEQRAAPHSPPNTSKGCSCTPTCNEGRAIHCCHRQVHELELHAHAAVGARAQQLRLGRMAQQEVALVTTAALHACEGVVGRTGEWGIGRGFVVATEAGGSVEGAGCTQWWAAPLPPSCPAPVHSPRSGSAGSTTQSRWFALRSPRANSTSATATSGSPPSSASGRPA